MKNQTQAISKNAKNAPSSPQEKAADHGAKSRSLRTGSAFSVFPDNPFKFNTSFEVTLDWIGASMEPEISVGNRALISRREDMYPTAGELIVGLLKSGHLVFGAHETIKPGLCRIAFINPDFAPTYYPESEFRWFYPVDYILVRDSSAPHFIRLSKKLEFHPSYD